jgi:hypothetical protein
MDSFPPLPGDRILGYRNSLPRRLRVVGLGARGSRTVRELAGRGYPNVEIVANIRPLRWDEIVGGEPTEPPNMIIIVCGEGDEHLFSVPLRKPGMLVTFVVLKQTTQPPEAEEAAAAQMRGLSDLFVTTSDADYIGDLVANLAS